MQYESHNYNDFIIFFATHFFPKDFIYTLDSLIKYLMNIKDIGNRYDSVFFVTGKSNLLVIFYCITKQGVSYLSRCSVFSK